MNTSALRNWQDTSESDFATIGDTIYASYAPWMAWYPGGNPSGIIPDFVYGQNDAPAAGSAGAGSTVIVSSGGITFNLLFDSGAPATFQQGITQAASILASQITDHITVNLVIHYSGTGGGAFAGPDHGLFEPYSTIRADLVNNATPGDTNFNFLPASIASHPNIGVWNAQLKLWGLIAANDTTTDDGSATFATDINPNLLVGVALHELTHALGRIPYGPEPDIFDMFRFTSAGNRLFLNGNTAPAAYFSVDGGATKIADYGQNSDPSDFLNSGVQGSSDPFNEFYNGATTQHLTAIDLTQLDVLGFHIGAPVNHAPAVTVPSANVSATAGQTLQASSLFSATDSDNDALLYYLYDGTPSANSGHFVVNGTVVPAGVTYTVTAAQWAQTTFVAGTVPDDIFMQATDTKALSNTGHVTVNVGSSQISLGSSNVPANSDDYAALIGLNFDDLARVMSHHTDHSIL
jgi:hypothetical protein